jgi:hypothetical protein
MRAFVVISSCLIFPSEKLPFNVNSTADRRLNLRCWFFLIQTTYDGHFAKAEINFMR